MEETHEEFPFARKVLEGYWRQATNMTTDDQWEYKRLIECEKFRMIDQNGEDTESLISHFFFNDFLISPTWAKYVFLHSLFGDESISAIDNFVIETFKSFEILDFEKEYRTHHRDPDLPDGEVTGEVQTSSIASPHSPLLNSGSTEQFSANCDQSNISSLLGQSSPVADDQTLSVDDDPLTPYDLEKLETRLRTSIIEMEKRILQKIYELSKDVRAATINNYQIPTYLYNQTNLKKRKQDAVP